MTPDRWARIETLFERAIEFPDPAEREAFVTRECGDDASLRTEVLAMLASTAHAADALHGVVSSEAGKVAAAATSGNIGRRIGPYRLVSLLGEGGMGAVYLAERDDAEFNRKVAIKIVPRALGSPESIARFRDERQILAALVHRNIVRLIDGGSTEDRQPYLVMEHVEGMTIKRYADAKALTVRQRVELVRQVCAALQYAHGNLVVHRDIKPSNILVDADGTAKVLDFGIAKLLSSSPTGRAAGFAREAKTRTGLALFTPEYASPEQVRGEPVATTTDVYSTGAVLFELVTGRPPLELESHDPLETIRTIAEVDPPRASTIAPAAWRREVAGDLDNIIAKALQKEAARRYASMEQLADDLGRFLDGMPVLARNATLGYRTQKFVRRNKGAVAAGLVISSTLVGATLVSLRQAHRADDQASRADKAAGLATKESANARVAAERALQETERARAAEQKVQAQLDQIRAEQTRREAAENDAKAKGTEVELSKEQLRAALAVAQEEARVAADQSKKAHEAELRAQAAATSEKALREQLEVRLAQERAKREAAENRIRSGAVTDKLP